MIARSARSESVLTDASEIDADQRYPEMRRLKSAHPFHFPRILAEESARSPIQERLVELRPELSQRQSAGSWHSSTEPISRAGRETTFYGRLCINSCPCMIRFES